MWFFLTSKSSGALCDPYHQILFVMENDSHNLCEVPINVLPNPPGVTEHKINKHCMDECKHAALYIQD